MNRLKLHAALFTVAFLFSANYVISKLGMREFAPLSFAWMRIAGAAIVLAFVARKEPPFSHEDSRRVAGCAILAVVVNRATRQSGGGTPAALTPG